MTEPETFGPWVRHRRREFDLTQEELARRVGCARITIRKIEAGQLRPSKQMAGLLGDQLGIAPKERDDFLHFARTGVATATAATHGPRHNLPLQLTSLVGRESEVARARQLLEKARLLTLTGSGGTGKSRLSLQVAAEVFDSFSDGVWLIELAPLSDPARVPSAIASVLGVRQEPGRPLMDTLLDWLRNRQILLVLDNCEHLLDACVSFVDAVLHAGHETRILASSRQPLGMAGETCFRVPSLGFPALPAAMRLQVDELQDYPATRLFVERAAEALATFTVSDTNATAISEICRRLDGIPLAIELAAARVKALRVEQIAERLDDRFRLLTNASRTALPRHQTLHSLIDWSYNLLSEPERRLLRRLSIFAGGWTLEAAEEICSSDGIEPSEILDLLTQLAEKSLIALDEQATLPRYRILETIREFARGKSLEAGEAEQLGDRHLHFFLQMAQSSRPFLNTGERAAWLLRLESDHDNLLAALEWAIKRDTESARWMAGILERFWFYGDHLSEARTWYQRVLDGPPPTDTSKGLALAVLSSGCVAFNLELMDEAQDSLEASVGLWQRLGDPEWLASAMGWLAYLLLNRGEFARAEEIYAGNEELLRAHSDHLSVVWILSSWGTAKCALQHDDPSGKALLDDALSLARMQEDPFSFMMCYSCLGDWAMLQEDYATATENFLEALRWRRALGTRWIIAAGLWQVAGIMRLRGDYAQAQEMYAEALKLAQDLGDQRSQAHISQELGLLATHQGDMRTASGLLEASLTAFRRWSDPLGISRCLLGFADLQYARGNADAATRLLSFLESWLRVNKTQFLHFDRANYARSVSAARAQLDDPTFISARDAGQDLTLDQAIALALEPAISLPPIGHSAPD